MSYVSSHYDNNPNAPMGSWVGIDCKRNPCSITTITDPEEGEDKDAMLLEIDDVGFVFHNGNTLYIE